MILAAAQCTPLPLDVTANAASIAGQIEGAAARGAHLVVFPELCLTGYDPSAIAADPERLAVTTDDARLAPVAAACRAAGVAAVVNCAVREGRTLTITSLVFGPDGELLTAYDKLHLSGEENDVFVPGDRDGRFTLHGVPFALAICYDSRFPDVAERAGADGCAVYLSSAVHDLETDVARGEPHYPALAKLGGLYVVLANPGGVTGSLTGCGRSAAWGPDGGLLAEGPSSGAGLVLVELPLGPS